MKNSEPLVSVLLPFYNGEEFVEEAIASVKNQTYKNIELIVINDSPENGSSRIFLENLQKKYDFKLINNEFNYGLTRSFVNGFLHSKGEYFSFMSQDDTFFPEKTKVQLEYLQKNSNCRWLYSNMEFWDVGENKKSIPDLSDTQKRIANGTVFPYFYHGHNLNGLYIQSSMATREIMNKEVVPIWCKTRADGWPVHIRLFEKYSDQVALTDDVVTLYRIHDTNTSKNHDRMFSLIVPTIMEICPKELREEVLKKHLPMVGIKSKKEKSSKDILVKLLCLFVPFRSFRRKIKNLLRYES